MTKDISKEIKLYGKKLKQMLINIRLNKIFRIRYRLHKKTKAILKSKYY